MRAQPTAKRVLFMIAIIGDLYFKGYRLNLVSLDIWRAKKRVA